MKIPGFPQGIRKQPGPDFSAGIIRMNSQGTDLCQIIPAELQSAAPDNAMGIFLFIHPEISEMIIEFAQGPGQQNTFLTIAPEKFMNGFYVFYACFSNHNLSYIISSVKVKAEQEKKDFFRQTELLI